MATRKTRAYSDTRSHRRLDLESLEIRCMLTGSPIGELASSTRLIGYSPLEEVAEPSKPDDESVTSAFLAARMNEVFNLQSKPDSRFTIFLDFDGHVSVGSSWNNSSRPEIVHPPYDIDGDHSYFNSTELSRIETAWQRTAEDFAAFDVNVTTIDPGVAALTRTSGSDLEWGIRVVSTQDTFANCGCGGHAYINSFNDDDDTAALVYNSGSGALGETISHEIGHAVNLSHDGTSSSTYYGGHGSGATSWGAIMGAPFNESITQWDRGEYFDANNFGGGANYGNGSGDLEVITGTNGFGYRADDHGNSIATASELDVVNSTTLRAFGIIERNTDVDFFEFETPGGSLSLSLSALDGRPNLDIWAGIYDSTGSLVQQSNPSGNPSALLTANLPAGTYYLKVDGVGSHGVYNSAVDAVLDPPSPPWLNPSPTGYSDYGSLGQYWISGQIGANANTFSIAGVTPEVVEGDAGSSTVEFTVTRSSSSAAASVAYNVDPLMPRTVGGTYPDVANSSDFVGGIPAGVLNFADGELTKTLSFQVVGDSTYEPDEYFVVRLSDASSGWDMAQSTATGLIITDESQLKLSEGSAINGSQIEGDPFADSVVLRWRQVQYSSENSDNWGLDNVSVSNSTFADDFQSGIDDLQWGRIQNAVVLNRFAGGSPSLYFTFDGTREATTRILDPQPGDVVSFDLIFGDGSNGGDNADAGEDVVLEFSNDNGSSWQVLERYDTEDYTSWTTIDVELPAEIKTPKATEYVFDVVRKGDTSIPATLSWQVTTAGPSNPASAGDFVGGVIPSGMLSFSAGEASKPIVVEVVRDVLSESDERFALQLTNANSAAVIEIDSAFSLANRSILDDESKVDMRSETQLRWRQVASAGTANSDTWGLDNLNITSAGFTDDFDPNIDDSQWSIVTGVVANNFVGGTGNELFMNGGSPRLAVTRELQVQSGDTVDFDLIIGTGSNGGDNADSGEDIFLELSLNGGTDWTTLHRYDTEDYPTWTSISEDLPDIAVADVVELPEGNSGQTLFELTLLRNGDLEKFVLADWQVAGTGDNPASAADFVGGSFPTGTATFNPGEETATVVVAVAGDVISENDETFGLSLVSSSGGEVGTTVAVATILNDDEGVSGDFNADGVYDCTDIDLLTSEVASGVFDADFDMNGDGALNLSDVGAWLAVAGQLNIGADYLFGDGNLDGVVDASDFNVWNTNKFTTQTEWCSGNYNADNVVDTSDFNIWNGNKFQSSLGLARETNGLFDHRPFALLGIGDDAVSDFGQGIVQIPTRPGSLTFSNDSNRDTRSEDQGEEVSRIDEFFAVLGGDWT